MFTTGELHNTWKHEWLHHYDLILGIPGPTGSHNALFDARLEAMGLLEPE